MAFIKNTVFYAVGNLLPKVSTFFLLPLYTAYMGPKEYGISESMVIISSILSVLFSLGIHNSVYRLYYDYKTNDERAKFFGTVNIGITTLSIIGTIIVLVLHKYVSLIFKDIPFFPYFLLAILFTLINNFGEVPKAFLMIKEKALTYVLIGLFQFIVTTSFVIWFVIFKGAGAIGMLKAQVLGSLLLLPYLLFLSYQNFVFKFDMSMMTNILRYSLPSIPTIISAWILNLSDRIFIERYLSSTDVGVYSLGYKIAGVVGIIFVAFDMTYMPYFFKLANSVKQESIEKIRVINNLYIYFLLFVTFSVSLFSKEIIETFFTASYFNAYIIIMIISYVFFFTQAGSILGKNLAQSKKVKQGMFIDIMCAFINIVFNFLLIPIIGIYGAAWATLISFIFSSIVYFIYSSRNTFYVPLKIVTISILFTSSIMILLVFNFYLKLNYIHSIFAKSSIIVIIFIAMFFFYSKNKKQLSQTFFQN